ncbi:hypothetical protein DXG01_012064 [Tephrocybe rancida]|nr:hypothetical protein DXG01_012064 [Tephrocybe rancida]
MVIPPAYMEDVYGCVGLNPSAMSSFTKAFVTVTDRNNLLAASIHFVYLSFACGVSSDILIAGTLCIFLTKHRNGLKSLLAALNSREALWERCFGATLMELSSTILRTATPVRAQIISMGASQAD